MEDEEDRTLLEALELRVAELLERRKDPLLEELR